MTRFKKAGYFLGEGMAMGCTISASCQIEKLLLIKPIPNHPGMVYSPTFGCFLMVKYGFHVGKYTSPMDSMGIYHAMIWMGSTEKNWNFCFHEDAITLCKHNKAYAPEN